MFSHRLPVVYHVIMVFQPRLRASPVRWFLQLSWTFVNKIAVTSMSEVPVLSINTVSPLNFSKVEDVLESSAVPVSLL